MELASDASDDGHVDDPYSKSPEQHTLSASARELQRAAGKVLTHAADAEDAETLAVSLAYIEEALDRLAVGMLQMAYAVTVEHADPGAAADAHTLAPAPEVLCFHLRLVADKLREPQLACQSSRTWTRRLLDSESAPAQLPDVDGTSEAPQPLVRSMARSL